MVDYASRLDAAIKHAQSSVRQLSDALGVSYQAVKKILDGKSTALNAENHERAARYLGVNSFWLATGEEGMLAGIVNAPAPAPIPLRQYRTGEATTLQNEYSWPFKTVSLQAVISLPERRIGMIEGYMKRVIEDASLFSNGTDHTKSHS